MPPKKATAMGSKPDKKQKAGEHQAPPIASSDKVLSKEEEEEMSSALIAQLLAQEGGGDHLGYYAEYNNDANYGSLGDGDYSDDDDDYRNDYSYRPKSRSRRGGRPGRKRARQAPPPVPKPTLPVVSATQPSEETTVETTTSSENVPSAAPTSIPEAQQDANDNKSISMEEPVTAKVDVPVIPPKPKRARETIGGFNTGTYSEAEEKAFVEALDIFGRNWRQVEAHVGTRDANSIRSHAQKHFIKLFRDNTPLPPRVLETGPGYTLSGNDLDPYSSAARPYLSQSQLDDPTLLPAQGGTRFTPESGAIAKAQRALAKEKKVSISTECAKEMVKDAVKDMQELKIRKAVKVVREPPREKVRDTVIPPELVYSGRTDYSKARLRTARERVSISFRQMASDLDPLTMVKCEPFCGQPNSGVLGCQPFGIKVQSNVLLGMDFHAHLMTTEVIGFLAGEWNASTKVIHIKAIFPCRSLQTGQNHVNVEMDPTSEFEVRQEIEKRNMRIVGWYHSHPTFTPDPSMVDIENQTSYQSLFKDEAMNEEPFVGAIVGPYDERLPGMSSVINWFYISQSPQERGHPKRLLYDLIEDSELPEEEATSWTKLFDEYRNSPERTNFKEQWRQDESETKLQKMLVSLGRRMPWLRNTLLKSKENMEGGDIIDKAYSMIADDATSMINVDELVNIEDPVNVEDPVNIGDLVKMDDSVDANDLANVDIPLSMGDATNVGDPANVGDTTTDEGSPVNVGDPVSVDDPAIAEDPAVMNGNLIIGDTPVMDNPTVIGDTEVVDSTSIIGDTPVMDNPVVIGDTAAMDITSIVGETAVMADTAVVDNAIDMAIEQHVSIPQHEDSVVESSKALETGEATALQSEVEEGTSMEGIVPTEDEQVQCSLDESTESERDHEHNLERSLSNESAESIVSKSFIGLGNLINDPFLIRVEQELASWEPVAG
ncbi:hypothetical protein BGX34_001005 [Mortierella sp. NVP85]|nr:hypothetical protein BGX34_001005 [Mortierella sp. NVP85]